MFQKQRQLQSVFNFTKYKFYYKIKVAPVNERVSEWLTEEHNEHKQIQHEKSLTVILNDIRQV